MNEQQRRVNNWLLLKGVEKSISIGNEVLHAVAVVAISYDESGIEQDSILLVNRLDRPDQVMNLSDAMQGAFEMINFFLAKGMALNEDFPIDC